MLVYLYIFIIGIIIGFLLGLAYWHRDVDKAYKSGVHKGKEMSSNEVADRKAHELALLAEVENLQGTIAWYRDRSVFGKGAGDVFDITFDSSKGQGEA